MEHKQLQAELEEMAKEWKADGEKQGGVVKDVSIIISELLNTLKKTEAMGIGSIAAVLTMFLIAIDHGEEDVVYVADLIGSEYIANMIEEEPGDGETNMFNEDGSRVTLKELGIE